MLSRSLSIPSMTTSPSSLNNSGHSSTFTESASPVSPLTVFPRRSRSSASRTPFALSSPQAHAYAHSHAHSQLDAPKNHVSTTSFHQVVGFDVRVHKDNERRPGEFERDDAAVRACHQNMRSTDTIKHDKVLSWLGMQGFRQKAGSSNSSIDKEIYEEVMSLVRRVIDFEDDPFDPSIAHDTLDVYVPLADRLGIWRLKSRLEDLAFYRLYPVAYNAVSEATFKRRNEEALSATVSAVKRVLISENVLFHDVCGRPKSLYGVWVKGGAHVYPADAADSVKNVLDVSALRIIVDNKHDCYRAMRAVQNAYSTVRGRFKDYIKRDRKPNGYRSLHDTILSENGTPVEVQVRTYKMHYVAEFGTAAHWAYKEDQKRSSSLADPRHHHDDAFSSSPSQVPTMASSSPLSPSLPLDTAYRKLRASLFTSNPEGEKYGNTFAALGFGNTDTLSRINDIMLTNDDNDRHNHDEPPLSNGNRDDCTVASSHSFDKRLFYYTPWKMSRI